ncbi:MAG: hypothetical protein WCO56_01000 [Verrucomicrobiota bacterium]
MKLTLTLVLALLLLVPGVGFAADAPKPLDSLPAFQAKLQTTLSRHLNLLLGDDGSVAMLKGKSLQ